MTAAQIEASFYRTLNALVEPIVRVGAGSPCVLPTGLIVLEVVGRRSGATHRIPVVAAVLEDHAIVGTLRGERSQWMKNVRANAEVRYWLHGRPRDGTALVFDPGRTTPDMDQLPKNVRNIAAGLSRLADASFAVVTPRR